MQCLDIKLSLSIFKRSHGKKGEWCVCVDSIDCSFPFSVFFITTVVVVVVMVWSVVMR